MQQNAFDLRPAVWPPRAIGTDGHGPAAALGAWVYFPLLALVVRVTAAMGLPVLAILFGGICFSRPFSFRRIALAASLLAIALLLASYVFETEPAFEKWLNETTMP